MFVALRSQKYSRFCVRKSWYGLPLIQHDPRGCAMFEQPRQLGVGIFPRTRARQTDTAPGTSPVSPRGHRVPAPPMVLVGPMSILCCPAPTPEIVELRGVPIRTRHAADAPKLAPTLDDNAAGLAYSFVRRRGGWSQALPRMCSALWPQDASAFVSYILSIPRASGQKRGSKARRKREEWERQ